jgi:hypothetical protein
MGNTMSGVNSAETEPVIAMVTSATAMVDEASTPARRALRNASAVKCGTRLGLVVATAAIRRNAVRDTPKSRLGANDTSAMASAKTVNLVGPSVARMNGIVTAPAMMGITVPAELHSASDLNLEPGESIPAFIEAVRTHESDHADKPAKRPGSRHAFAASSEFTKYRVPGLGRGYRTGARRDLMRY